MWCASFSRTSMLEGIGVDIVQNSRFETLSENTVNHILSTAERKEAGALSGRARLEFLASRFAAKEALAKALGTGFTRLQPRHITVVHDEMGKPCFSVSGEVAELFSNVEIHLSISHEKDYSVAMVVLDGKK